jgi:hypothetical protein
MHSVVKGMENTMIMFVVVNSSDDSDSHVGKSLQDALDVANFDTGTNIDIWLVPETDPGEARLKWYCSKYGKLVLHTCVVP